MLTLLGSKSFDAEVVCPIGGDLEGALLKLGVRVYPLEFGKYSLRQNPAWHLGFLLRFRRILQASKPNVVVINLDGNTPLVTLSAVSAGIPIVRFCRFEFFPPKRPIDLWCWNKAAAVICPSDWVRQQILSWGGASYGTRTYRLYDPYIGVTPATAPKEAPPIEANPKDDIVIGCIGRLHRCKRFETAIEALALIRASGENARLFIIGGDHGSSLEHNYLEELRELVDKLDIGSAVTFLGRLPHDEVSKALSLMDVLVLPSESESFGMVLMEAWANGVPSVCTDVAGCGEITRASGGGLLARIGDASHFAAQILSLIRRPHDAMSMGLKGEKWVKENCDPKHYASCFKLIINKTILRG